MATQLLFGLLSHKIRDRDWSVKHVTKDNDIME